MDAEPLTAWLARRFPNGAPIDLALDLIRQIASALDALHEHGFVHRCVAPEHILVDSENRVSLVGMGNATRKNTRVSTTKEFFHPQFSAPEIERELSGKFIIPRNDIYSLGCLLGFLVSGEAPTGYPESPWSRTAHDRILALPVGVGLLIAHCLQPMAKKRFAHMGRILPFLEPQLLPDKTHRDFAELTLTVPWLGNQPNAARVGHLSPGPLVNRSGITQNLRAVDLPPSMGVDENDPAFNGLPATDHTDPLLARPLNATASDENGRPLHAASLTTTSPNDNNRLSRWTLAIGIVIIVLAVIAVLRQIPTP
jgi:serine/threonine protein kinase